MFKVHSSIGASILFLFFLFPGCIAPQKMDAFVAGQFNNELPKPDKKKNPDISVTTTISSDPKKISVSGRKTSNVLPLIIYWQFDHRYTCELNPAIGVNYFKKVISQQSNKLIQKLNGRQLELNVEQIPQAFALTNKERWIFILIQWQKLYVEPDFKDMIVSYKVSQNGSEIESGKITVSNKQQNQGIGLFQSWKSSTSEFLGQYSTDITEMSKTFVNNLIQVL
ncbi:MAG: hypothetical protein HZB42_06385 [Sphingobacteriales bacterium]|nr:hypothetical protein [Sphingobacteriales bacterium]